MNGDSLGFVPPPSLRTDESGRGNGIAPVTPPTPPDMRSSASGGWSQQGSLPGVSLSVDTSYWETPRISARHPRPWLRPVSNRRFPSPPVEKRPQLPLRPVSDDYSLRSEVLESCLCSFGPLRLRSGQASLHALSSASSLLRPLLTSLPLSRKRSPRVRCQDYRPASPDSTAYVFR
jgi:hypothetical protein